MVHYVAPELDELSESDICENELNTLSINEESYPMSTLMSNYFYRDNCLEFAQLNQIIPVPSQVSQTNFKKWGYPHYIGFGGNIVIYSNRCSKRT